MDKIEVHVQSYDTDDPEEVLFHMAQLELYKSVAASGEAYFPLYLRQMVCSHVPQLFIHA